MRNWISEFKDFLSGPFEVIGNEIKGFCGGIPPK